MIKKSIEEEGATEGKAMTKPIVKEEVHDKMKYVIEPAVMEGTMIDDVQQLKGITREIMGMNLDKSHT